jgi:hypothetical protein
MEERMPKVVLEFNLPEDIEEYKLHMDGPALNAAVCDFADELRRMYKYDSDKYTKEELDLIEKIRESLHGHIGEFIP